MKKHLGGRRARALARFAAPRPSFAFLAPAALAGLASFQVAAQSLPDPMTDPLPQVRAQAQSSLRTSTTEEAYVGGSVAVTHESNLFRAADNQARSSDTYSTVSVNGGFDRTIGRQRVYGVGSVSKVSFNDNSQLDHVSYALNTGVDWQTAGNISGKLDIVQNRGLADYGEFSNNNFFDKNLETSQQITAIARIGMVTRLTVEGQLQHRDVDYSSRLFDFREFNQDAASVNVRYQFSEGLSVAGGFRYTDGEYPTYARAANGSAIADEFKRRDLDLLVDWIPTGQSTVNARLSVGDVSSSQATQNDFSGVTGAVTWTYQPTGKLQFVTLFVRDTGAESRFVNFGPSETSRTDTSRLSTTLKVAARYEATSKVQLTGSAQFNHRSLTDSILQTGSSGRGASGSDDLTRFELGFRFVATRTAAFQCNLARERRKTDTTLSYPYSVNSVGCLAQLRLNLI